jgi:hypothetical protein
MIPPKSITQADLVEAIEQMTLLGYKNEETVFYRAFTGNDDKFPKNLRSPFPEVPAELTKPQTQVPTLPVRLG